MKRCVQTWRKMLLETLDSQELIQLVKKTNEHRLRKIMDVMKDKIRFPSELNNHLYHFQDPDFVINDKDIANALKVLRQVKQPKEVKELILKELKVRLSKLTSE